MEQWSEGGSQTGKPKQLPLDGLSSGPGSLPLEALACLRILEKARVPDSQGPRNSFYTTADELMATYRLNQLESSMKGAEVGFWMRKFTKRFSLYIMLHIFVAKLYV